MANRCAGLDPTWAHLPPPHAAGHCRSSVTSSWLFPAAAFENEALTAALRASMSPANASSSSYPTTPSSSTSTTSSASDLLSGGSHDAPAASTRPRPLAARAGSGTKATGRVIAKRKPRPSRRPPVTFIIADPADFRRMVQEVTGFPAAVRGRQPATAASDPGWRPAAAPPACALLPTLDTSAFLLDRAAMAAATPGPDANKSSSGGAPSSSPAMAAVTAAAAAAVVEDDRESSVMQELEAMARDFPTLESWGII